MQGQLETLANDSDNDGGDIYEANDEEDEVRRLFETESDDQDIEDDDDRKHVKWDDNVVEHQKGEGGSKKSFA